MKSNARSARKKPLLAVWAVWTALTLGVAEAASYRCDCLEAYVTNGLVAHWDGIRNVGANVPHASDSEVWKNLVAGAPDVTRVVGDETKAGVWEANGYRFNGGDLFKTASDVKKFGGTLTIQLFCDTPPDRQTTQFPTWFSAADFSSDIWKWEDNANLNLYFGAVLWNQTSCGATQANWNGRVVNAFIDNTAMGISENDTVPTLVAGQGSSAADRTQWKWPYAIGGNVDSAGANRANRYVTGMIYAVRVYERLLDTVELAANEKIDKARFCGAVTTNVVVTSSRPAAQGVETNGVYEVEGAWTFTARSVLSPDGKMAYEPVGYTIEVLDAGVWSQPVRYEGTSYDYDLSRESRPVRLKWLWRTNGGLRLFVR